jgi:hypothetical protein
LSHTIFIHETAVSFEDGHVELRNNKIDATELGREIGYTSPYRGRTGNYKRSSNPIIPREVGRLRQQEMHQRGSVGKY